MRFLFTRDPASLKIAENLYKQYGATLYIATKEEGPIVIKTVAGTRAVPDGRCVVYSFLVFIFPRSSAHVHPFRFLLRTSRCSSETNGRLGSLKKITGIAAAGIQGQI